jgi:hypothetical protein
VWQVADFISEIDRLNWAPYSRFHCHPLGKPLRENVEVRHLLRTCSHHAKFMIDAPDTDISLD